MSVCPAPARLVSPAGDDLAPGGLVWAARSIDEEALGEVRRHAFAAGYVLEREHHGVLGYGLAAVIELPAGLAEAGAGRTVTDLLGTIALAPGTEDLAGGGPIALGALPFWNDVAGRLVVPSITAVSSEDDGPLAIVVAAPDELEQLLAGFPFVRGAKAPPHAAPSAPPDGFELRSQRSHAEFRGRVEAALAAIRAGELDKVVLVREVAVQANRPLRQPDLLARLRALHPSCTAFALDGFIGASPELLCRRQARVVRAQPLAGTVARSGDPEEDDRLGAAMLVDTKELAEHAFVVDAVRDMLAGHCDALDVPPAPHLLELRNVAHLATAIEGRLAGEHPPGILELVAELHPTPAVGGSPRPAALDYLAKYEDVERDRFAGPVGYVRADGDGEFWIGIRSAIVSGTHARLFAGVGIVADSDPVAELTETQLKLQALLAVAVRP